MGDLERKLFWETIIQTQRKEQCGASLSRADRMLGEAGCSGILDSRRREPWKYEPCIKSADGLNIRTCKANLIANNVERNFMTKTLYSKAIKILVEQNIPEQYNSYLKRSA